jgi:outer membrane cobalamin receptor
VRKTGFAVSPQAAAARIGGFFPGLAASSRVTAAGALASALFLVFGFFAPGARAAVELPEETVVASPVYGESEDKYRSPGSVTVIRPEEREGEQRTLPDLLEEVPGLRVIRLNGRHGYAVASIRGSTSAQVAVYVDGALMNLQSESAVDLSAIPVDNVERIEVYKGYVPSRFGAQAMGGVINIVTKTPKKPETFVSLGVGSFGRYKGNISLGTASAGGKFFGAFGYETYDGDFEYFNDNGTPYNTTDDYTGIRRNNGFENMDALLKWEDAHWRARASWVRRNRELALIAPGLDRPGASQPQSPTLDTERWDISLGRSQTAGSIDWGWDVLYTAQKKEYDSRRGAAPSRIGGPYVDRSEYDASRLGLSFNASGALGERHFLELYAEYFREELDVDGNVLYDRLNGIDHYGRDDALVNLQDSIALDRAGSLILTPSIRWHKLDDEDHFTWQAAVTKEFSPSLMLKSTYGTYARSPNLYERYGDGAFIRAAENDLKWETGVQFDAGVIWSPVFREVKSRFSLSGFWRESENLIEFDMENPRFGVYTNIARADVKGAELEASFDWRKWSAALSATWLDGENKTDDEGSTRFYGMTLPNRPKWSYSARLTRGFGVSGEGGSGSVFVEYQFVGENYVDRSEKVLFDARNVWNAGAKYNFSDTTELIIGVNDIFNESDNWRMFPETLNGPTKALDYPVEGRAYYMTLSMRF